MSIDLMGVGVVVPTAGLRAPSSSNTNLNLLRSFAPLYHPRIPPFRGFDYVIQGVIQ